MPFLKTIDIELEARLREAREGSAEAAQWLVDHYGKAILYVIRHRMPDRIRTLFDSEDFLQETRLQLLIRDIPPGIYQSQETFLAYMFKIARNQVGMTARHYLETQKADINREVSLESVDLQANEFQDKTPTGTDRCEAEGERTHFLDGLSAEERTIFLYLWQGYSYGEIAIRMDLDVTTVRRIVKRVLKKG